LSGRIHPLGRDELGAEVLAELRGVFPRADRFLTDGPDAPPMPPILGLFGRHVTITGPWLAYNGALLDHGALDERTRELLILATARLANCPYLWNEHLGLAARAGVVTTEIDALAEDDISAWSSRDRALLAAVDDLFDRYTVSDGTWRALEGEFDERELLELLFIIGTYAGLAMVLNGVGLQPVASDNKEDRP
jgi:AhpD family alkylhydroperoxidase